jgi:crotonobetainyl-CoA:carnitine CoA-transferase CaiB-like acyl-CoA transferase
VDPVAAPAVGEHTHEVLRDLLGYDQDRLAEVAAAGAFGGLQTRPESAES